MPRWRDPLVGYAIRGDIIDSTQPGIPKESSSFRGEQVVERYVVKDGITVARDRIDMPITATADA